MGHTKGFLILGQLLSYTGPGNNTCQKKKTFPGHHACSLQSHGKISLWLRPLTYTMVSSGITLRKNHLHLSKRHRVKFFCLLFFCSKLRLSFLFKGKKHRAVEEDIHCWRWVKSIKGTPHLQLQVVLFKLFWRSIILKFRKIPSLD